MPADLQQVDVAIFARGDRQMWIASGIDLDVCTFGYSRQDALDRFKRALDQEEDDAKESKRKGLGSLPKPPKGSIPAEFEKKTLERLRTGRWSR